MAAYGTVTSTSRTVAHNIAVGGVWNSYHLSGRAIDVARRNGIAHSQLEAALRRAGYVLVESLDEGDHSHFAFGMATKAGRLATVDTPDDINSKPVRLAADLETSKLAADQHGSLKVRELPKSEAGVGLD